MIPLSNYDYANGSKSPQSMFDLEFEVFQDWAGLEGASMLPMVIVGFDEGILGLCVGNSDGGGEDAGRIGFCNALIVGAGVENDRL